ncbi:MAG: hypothetical protein GC168_11145 [Candidatus Hydrogenedens sp.]|nr:hypothetical protein [Candidatus Hydrogenedens sp.]
MSSSSPRPSPTDNCYWHAAGRLLKRAPGAFVALAAAVLAYQYLFVQTNGIPGHGYTDWYEPSALWAAGHGWSNPGVVKAPQSAEFIAGREPALDTSKLEGLTFEENLDENQQTHKYLLRLVGVWWWLFGINWHSLGWMQVGVFALTAWLLFRLLRAAGPWPLALAGALAFLCTPGVLSLLPTVRDFNKIPFFFLSFLFMLLLTRQHKSRSRRYGIPIALGLTIGIGIGFRQDVLALLPAALLVAAASPCSTPGWRKQLQARATMAGLVLLGFLPFGAPILLAYTEGSQGAHQFVMGLAANRDDALGLTGASYERLAIFSDNMATVAKAGYARREHGATHPVKFVSPEMARDGAEYAWETITTFPADMLLRGYAAVLWILRGCPTQQHAPTALGFLAWGPWLAGCFFVLLGAQDWRRAVLGVLLLTYLGGYLSIQFEPRHAVHLAFLPAFFVVAMAGGVWGVVRGRQKDAVPIVGRPWLRTRALSLLCFAAVAVPMLALPYVVARAWQGPQVQHYAQAADEAALQPIATRRVELGDFVYFEVADPSALLTCTFDDLCEDYLAVALNGGVPAIGIACEAERDDWDTFRFDYPLPPEAAESQSGVKVFFPAYEVKADNQFFAGWSRFSGVVLRAEDAKHFAGLFRVADTGPFPLFLTMAVKQDASEFQSHQRLRLNWQSEWMTPPPPEYYVAPLKAKAQEPPAAD